MVKLVVLVGVVAAKSAIINRIALKIPDIDNLVVQALDFGCGIKPFFLLGQGCELWMPHSTLRVILLQHPTKSNLHPCRGRIEHALVGLLCIWKIA